MVNDLGVDPNEWFTESTSMNEQSSDGEKYFDWEDTAPCEYEPPRPEEEIADDWFTDKPKEEEKTIHHKMYEIATAKYNPFAVGGSENLGGSENVHDK